MKATANPNHNHPAAVRRSSERPTPLAAAAMTDG